MNNNETLTDTKIFIAKYKAAIKLKFSKQEFSEYLGIQPDSISRRRLRIQDSTQHKLEHLTTDPEFDGDIDVERVEEFEALYRDMLAKDEGSKIIDYTTTETRKVFVITSAQNATPIHENFFNSLLKYCEIRDAKLMVIPYRYRNPTSIWTQHNKDHEWWYGPLSDYIVNDNIRLCKGLQIFAQIPITPTQGNPLSGFDGYSGEDSSVYGHPKVQLKTVATPSKNMPKILTTTGACTIENYTDSKAGHKGLFHHNISAIVVEVEDDKFHIRHIHSEENGNFYDLNYYYTSTGRNTYGGIAGMVPGDIHAEFIDDDVEAATFVGSESMVEVLNPDVMVYQDLDDFYRRNHHHKNNDLIAYGKHHLGRDNVEEGLQLSADFVDRHTRPNMMNLIPRANHLDAFDRWLEECDPKLDLENAMFYHWMKYNQYRNVEMTDTGFKSIDPFRFWCENPMDQRGLQSLENTKFLERDESYVVCGIEIGFHGDQGPNGSRGSLTAFSKIGPKTVIGHSHSPGILDGAYQTGVSARRDLEYAVGPSSWLHTHCIIYPNGSRALINVVNGKWRAHYD